MVNLRRHAQIPSLLLPVGTHDEDARFCVLWRSGKPPAQATLSQAMAAGIAAWVWKREAAPDWKSVANALGSLRAEARLTFLTQSNTPQDSRTIFADAAGTVLDSFGLRLHDDASLALEGKAGATLHPGANGPVLKPRTRTGSEIFIRANDGLPPAPGSAILPLPDGAEVGVDGLLAFSLQASALQLLSLGADIRAFDPNERIGGPQPSIRVRIFHYPLMTPTTSGAAETVEFDASIDPAEEPGPGARSALAFRGNGFRSGLLTTHGHRVRFVPTKTSRLVFSAGVKTLYPDGRPRIRLTSLAPSGAFGLAVEGDEDGNGWPAQHGLPVGHAGTESWQFTPCRTAAPGDVLEFVPHQAALLAHRLREQVPAAAATQDTLLPLARTSWMWLRRADRRGPTPQEVSHPQAAPLYAFRGDGAAVLEPAARQDLPENAEAVAPVLPFGALLDVLHPAANAKARASEALWIVEDSAVTPLRRRLLSNARTRIAPARHAGADEGIWVTSPQGFLVRVDNAGRWIEVRIALSEADPAIPSETYLAFRRGAGQRWAIEEALKHQSLFAVLHAPAQHPEIDFGTAELVLRAAGFRMAIPVDLPEPGRATRAPDEQAIVVFKFTRGRSLAGLVKDEKRSTWVMPEVLAADPEATQAKLKKALAELANNASDPARSEFTQGLLARFSDAVAGDWTGVAIFGATLPMIGLPDGLIGLSPGFEGTEIRVPVLGLDANRIQPKDGQPNITASGVFALIEYKKDQPNPDPGAQKPLPPAVGDLPAQSGFGMKVERLAALIENATLQRFSAKARLWLGSLFGVQLFGGSKPPVLDLEASYERRTGNQPEDAFLLTASAALEVKPQEGFVQRLAFSRARMTTTVQRKTSTLGAAKIEVRFGLDGEIEFRGASGSGGLPLVRELKVAFENTGVSLAFLQPESGLPKDVAFGLEAGKLRVEGEPAKGGLFGSFPLKLRSLNWSGFDLSGASRGTKFFSLPELGFTGFGLPKPDISDFFDFGLEFDFDMGNAGGLLSGGKRLGGRIVLGWPDWRRWKLEKSDIPNFPMPKLPTLGFRFEGGSGPLDIGVQGWLRLMAESVALEHCELAPKGSAGEVGVSLILQKLRLDVLGHVLPEEGGFDLVIVAKGGIDNLGWYGGFANEQPSGTLALSYVGLGQRLAPKDVLQLSGVPELVAKLKAIGDAKDCTGLKEKVEYDPQAGWLLGLDAAVAKTVGVQLGMVDGLRLYGLRLTIPPNTTSGFDLGVLYHRIADDLGVFAVEWVPPEAWRTFEAGAATFRIPAIGVEVFTNGRWKVDLGLPKGLDYTRSCQVQMLPFIGWGGVYLASKDAATSTMLPRAWACAPIVEAGIAVRVGLGVEKRIGPFSAGISISVYGVIEGAAGIAGDSAVGVSPGDLCIRLVGRVGVIAEVFGTIDFSIIRVDVAVRAWAEIGVDVLTKHAILLWIDAGVSVAVEVVVARIRIWRCTIEIKVSFAFSARIQFTWKVGDGEVPPALAAGMPGRDPNARSLLSSQGPLPPIVWDPAAHLPGWTPQPLTLMPGLDATLEVAADGRRDVRLVALLFCVQEDGAKHNPLAPLLQALFLWTAACGGALAQVGGQAMLDVSELEVLRSTSEEGMHTSQGRLLRGPDYGTVREFLKRALKVHLDQPPEGPVQPKVQKSAVVLPMLPDLMLKQDVADGVERDFGVVSPDGPIGVTEAYRQELREWFATAAAALQERERVLATAAPPTIAEVVFEDWILLLIQSTADSVLEAARTSTDVVDGKRPLAIVLSDLEARSSDLAGFASRFLLHGLRPPRPLEDGPTGQTFPLYELTGQTLPALPSKAVPAEYPILVRHAPRPEAKWFTVTGDEVVLTVHQQDAEDFARAPLPDKPVEVAPAPTASRVPRRVSLADPRDYELGGAARRLWRLPPNLASGPVELLARTTARPGVWDLPRTWPVSQYRWCLPLRIDLRQVRDRDGSPLTGLYEVMGGDRAARERLVTLLEPGNEALLQDLDLRVLVIRNKVLVPEAPTIGQVVLVKSNLSVDNEPPSAVALATVPKASADLKDDPAGFLTLLNQASIVRAGGFWLRYETSGGTLDDLFKPPAEPSDLRAAPHVVLLLRFAPALGNRLRDGLFAAVETPDLALLDPLPEPPPGTKIDPDALDLGWLDDDGKPALRDVATVASGLVVLQATQAPPPEASDGAVALAERYSLLAVEVADKADPDFFHLTADESLPFGPQEQPDSDAATPPAAAGASPQERYRIVIPLLRLAKENYWPGAPLAQMSHGTHVRIRDRGLLKPDAELNPYLGIGREVRLCLWQTDIYGHRLPVSAAEIPVLLNYVDPLLGPDRWPGVRLSWRPSVTAGSGQVELVLHFDPAGFSTEEAKKEARRALRRAVFQLAAPGATAKLSVLDAVGADVRADLIHFLRTAAPPQKDAKDLPKLQEHTQWVSVAVGTLAKGEAPKPFEVRLKVERTLHVPDGSPNEVARAELAVGPQLAQPAGWPDFAKRLEAALPGRICLRSLEADEERTVYTAAADFFCANTQGAPTSWSIRPLGTAPRSGEFRIPGPDTPASGIDDPSDLGREPVRDLDLDATVDAAMRLIDRAFAPLLADRLRGRDPTVYDGLARAKEIIALAFAGLLTDPLTGESVRPDAADGGADAHERVRQTVLRNLASAARIAAVLQVPASPGTDAGGTPPELYGDVVLNSTAGLVLSTARLRRGGGRSWLTAVASWPDSAKRSAVIDGVLCFHPRYVELPRKSRRPGDDYIPSDWLERVIAPAKPALETKLRRPLPLRRLPTTPTDMKLAELTEDHPLAKGRLVVPAAATLKDHVAAARRWHLHLTANMRLEEQDVAEATVRYDEPQATHGATPRSAERLTIDEAALGVLAVWLPNEERVLSQPDQATEAALRLAAIAIAFASALHDHVATAGRATLGRVVAPLCDKVGISRLTHGQDQRCKAPIGRFCIVTEFLDSAGALQGDKGIAREAIAWPGTRIGELDPPVASTTRGAGVAAILPDAAVDAPRFNVVMTDLDLLRQRRIGGDIRVVRNATLDGKMIDEAFVYRTPSVPLPSGFGVRREYDVGWLDIRKASGQAPGQALNAYLDALVAELSRGELAPEVRIGCLPALRVPLGPLSLQDRELGWREEPLPGLAPGLPDRFAQKLLAVLAPHLNAPARQRTDVGHPLELRLDVTIHGGSELASGLPLLAIRRLFVRLTELAWGPGGAD